MKLKLLTLFIVAFQVTGFSQQIERKNLLGEWAIEGWFGDSAITLKKFNPKKSSLLLIFGKNDSLWQHMYFPEPVGVCGNGMLFFEKANWTLDKNIISFDIKGGRIDESKFEYKITYTISAISKQSIILKKKETILFEER